MTKRLKVFILAVLMLTSCCFLLPVFAANNIIVIEAEDATEVTDPLIRNYQQVEFSGGKGIRIYNVPVSGKEYIASYDFICNKSGNYKLGAVGSIRGVSWTTDWTVYINSPETAAEKYDVVQKVSTQENSGLMNEFDLGNIRLKKGKNTLYFKISTSDLQSEGCMVLFMDCFKLEPVSGGVFSLESVFFPDCQTGVFEYDNDIKLQLDFTMAAPEAVSYDFEIVDLWSRRVSGGKITVKPDTESILVNLGRFKIGWYRVFLFPEGQSGSLDKYIAFSVTQPLSKRIKYEDTTLATDFAGSEMSETKKKFPDYVRALKLAGYDWIRDRSYAGYTSSSYLGYRQQMHDAGINIMDSAGQFGGFQAFRGNLLNDAYKVWNKAPQVVIQTGIFEVFNEVDLGNYGTADNYASYFKAASIGLSDNENNPIKSIAGMATYQGAYVDNMLQNDILKYADIYNYHSHSEIGTRSQLARIYANAYTDDALPVFNGETGLHQVLNSSGILSNEQMRVLTRYAITSAMKSVSNGTDKHFWFLFAPYIENNGNYSCFHTESLPYPAYSALSNMTYQLGAAKIKGEMANMPSGVEGYLFDDGCGNDVAVIWSNDVNYVDIEAPSFIYSDMLGYEEIKSAQAGSNRIKVSVSQDPIYIKFKGRCSENNYYPFNYKREYKVKTFAPHERIVLQQLWDYKVLSDVKQKGYMIDIGVPQTVTLNVYNLNDAPYSGTVNIECDKYISTNVKEQPFEIEPWGMQTLYFELVTTQEAEGGLTGNVKFTATTSDGKPVSPSVAMYQITQATRTIKDEDRFVFEDFYKQESWDLKNIAEGGKIVMTSNEEEKTASFKIDFSGVNWAFPFYNIDDPSIFEGTSGFVFDRVCAPGATTEVTQMYVYMKDGRNYYSGVKQEYKYSEESKQLIFPWSTFTLYYSPLGGVDIREFKFEDISAISIGISGGAKNQPLYTISNFGCFYSDNDADKVQMLKKMEFKGMEEGKVYRQGEELVLNAILPDDEIESVKVMIFNDKYDKFTVDGKNVKIDLSNLERGKYRVFVFAKNRMGLSHNGMFDFYIE